MEKPVYHRVLLKISGEALAGDKHSGLDFEVIGQVCDVVKKCLDMGVQVGLVVGGGNFWRGAKNSGGGKMERTRADHIGMLATVMNCLAVADVCEQKGIPVRVQTALEMRAIAKPYIRSRAIRHLEKGRVVIFGAGTGNPYFSTDTAAVLRAAEIDADVILLAKNIDGVYNADPAKDANAIKYDAISYEDVLALAPEQIAQADYRMVSDVRCIYVETAEDDWGYTQRYWVSVDTGLLVVAERLQDGETVYRMASLAVDETAPDAQNFVLPDGTDLLQT